MVDIALSAFSVFNEVLDRVTESGTLKEFRSIGNDLLVTLDGTEYYRSERLHCPQSHTLLTKDSTTEWISPDSNSWPTAPQLQRLAYWLDVPVDFLLTGNPDTHFIIDHGEIVELVRMMNAEQKNRLAAMIRVAFSELTEPEEPEPA